MKVQFPVKWANKEVSSEEEDDEIKRLINAANEEETPENYGVVVMDVKDIRNFNPVDDKHSILRTYDDDSYCIAIPFGELKKIYVELTGQSIIEYHVSIDSPVKAPKKSRRKKPPTNDEDEGISGDDDLFLK